MPLPRFRRSDAAPRCLLQERDIALLEDLRRYRCLTTSQLELLRGSDADPALRFVSRLTLTRRLKLLFHGQYVRRVARPSTTGMLEPVYLLDREGARALSLRHGEVTVRAPSQSPKMAALEHLLAINGFRVSLEVAARNAGMELREWRGSEAAKFTVTLNEGKRKNVPPRKVTLLPDGGFTLRTESGRLFYFLEVDLGSEASRILTEKCRAYYAFWKDGVFAGQYGVPPRASFRVLFIAPTEKRLITILNAISKLESGHGMFQVTLQDKMTPETIFTSVWRDAVQDELTSCLPE